MTATPQMGSMRVSAKLLSKDRTPVVMVEVGTEESRETAVTPRLQVDTESEVSVSWVPMLELAGGGHYAPRDVVGIRRNINGASGDAIVYSSHGDGAWTSDPILRCALTLPTIQTVLESASGAKLFAKFDLWSGYWQFPVHEDDRHKATFQIQSRVVESS